MPVTQINKLDIALEYLNLSCELYIKNKNLISAIHLAGAAEEIFGKYCKKNNIKTVRDDWIEIGDNSKGTVLDIKKSGKKFANYVYQAKNSIKHMNPIEEDELVSIDVKSELERIIRAAYINMTRLGRENKATKSIQEVIEMTNIYIDIED